MVYPAATALLGCNAIELVLWPVNACRYHRHHGKHHHPVSRLQRSGVRHVGTARPPVLPDPADGARRPARRLVEAARFRRLGSPAGRTFSRLIHVPPTELNLFTTATSSLRPIRTTRKYDPGVRAVFTVRIYTGAFFDTRMYGRQNAAIYTGRKYGSAIVRIGL